MNLSNQPGTTQVQQLMLSPISPVELPQNGIGLTYVIVSWPTGGNGMATLSFVSSIGSNLQASFNENSLPPNEANHSVFEMRLQASSNTPVGDHLCHVHVHHNSMLSDDLEFVVRVQQAVRTPVPIGDFQPQ